MKKNGMSQKRLDKWVDWSLRHLQNSRVDPFLQGWNCAFALIMSFEGIPKDVRQEISKATSYAESVLWKKTRKLKY